MTTAAVLNYLLFFGSIQPREKTKLSLLYLQAPRSSPGTDRRSWYAPGTGGKCRGALVGSQDRQKMPATYPALLGPEKNHPKKFSRELQQGKKKKNTQQQVDSFEQLILILKQQFSYSTFNKQFNIQQQVHTFNIQHLVQHKTFQTTFNIQHSTLDGTDAFLFFFGANFRAGLLFGS